MTGPRRVPVSSAVAYQELRVFNTDEVDFDLDNLDLPDLDHTVRIRTQRRRFWLRLCVGIVLVSVAAAIGIGGFAVIRGGFGSNSGNAGEGDAEDGGTQDESPRKSDPPAGKGEPSTPAPLLTEAPSETQGDSQPPDALLDGPAPVFTFSTLESYEHDKDAFTQGFLFADGIFYESTGLRGYSTVRKVNVRTGNVRKKFKMDDSYFAEGLAKIGDKLYQLTWKAGKGIIYDAKNLTEIGSWQYEGEGWGLTPNENCSVLYMSDGSSKLRVLDPQTMEEVGPRIAVTDDNKEIGSLNELEFIKGEIWANIWLSNRIARIHPESGRVVSWLDCTGLLEADHIPEGHRPDVLNGIAYDPFSEDLYLTGKKWPRVYKIDVVENTVEMKFRFCFAGPASCGRLATANPSLYLCRKPASVYCRTESFPGTDRIPFAEVLESKASLEVFPSDGSAPVKLTDALVDDCDSTRVVCWLRHYGCTLCRKQLSELAALSKETGVSVTAIGSGDPEQAARAKEELSFPGEVYSDPSRETYSALSFKKGMSTTFNVGGLVKVVESFVQGHSQRWEELPSDPFQQGGCLVLDQDGRVALWHWDDFAGDHLDLGTVKKLCAELRECQGSNGSR